MSLKNIHLKRAYSSDFDDILHEFYIPALAQSVHYDRLAGLFSSTSLAIAAKGILGLIRNGGSMRLIVSPKLSKKDIEVIVTAYASPEKFIEKRMLSELERLEDKFVRNHIFALGWMVANKKLEIKVALVYDDYGKLMSSDDIERCGIFHQKVGILKDSEENIVTFSGSINETATGWLKNIEEFKVFRSWIPSEEEYVNADIIKFNMLWDNKSPKVKVIEVPYAVKKKLIEIAPSDIEKIDLETLYGYTKTKRKIRLFRHQEEAVEAWQKNNMKGIFEMATGTGKTFAALGCLEKALNKHKQLATIISCPYQHLIQQWKREINKFGIKYDNLIIADSSNPLWKDHLVDSLIDIQLGYKSHVIILTTHSTFSSEKFTNIIRHHKNGTPLFLIADEVHGLGAQKWRVGLLDEYDLRLGLSATPKRWFDTAGTLILYEFFDDVVYEFGIEKAINTINPLTGKTYLVPYRYRPKFISLTRRELEEYIDKTKAIARRYYKTKNDYEKDRILEILLFKRSDIIKNAERKYEALIEILDELGDKVKWTLIYCSPAQLRTVMQILKEKRLRAHRFTMKEGTIPQRKFGGLTEREYILKNFAEQRYDVLVAIKCLDEGVDVPPARVAILMASSGNPREYIQRIGRVIRQYPGKKEATIYDIIVVPSLSDLPPELEEIERKIFKNELRRYIEIAKTAVNNSEALDLIYKAIERGREGI